MKLLVTMKNANKTLQYHLTPLSLSKSLNDIYLIRDFKSPDLLKISQFVPPFPLNKIPLLSFLYKFLAMCIISIVKKPNLVIGYLFFPHGLLSLLVGKITNRKTGVFLIAGPLEFYELGKSPVDKYAYTKDLPKFKLKNNVIKRIFMMYDYIFVAGSYTRNFLIKNDISPHKIVTIPYCLPFRKVERLEKKYDLIYVGRVEKGKHVDSIIAMANLLVNQFNKVDLKIMIIGGGSQLSFIKKMANEYNLNKNIEFLGYTSDIDDYLFSSKIFVNPSERETGPYTILEAFSCGVPVITSNCGDTVKDVVVNGYNGFIINDYDNVLQYVEKIVYLLDNVEYLDMLSEGAFNTMANKHYSDCSKIWDSFFSSM
jgi:glycosyltransferase involved in cell wall biosynthesis